MSESGSVWGLILIAGIVFYVWRWREKNRNDLNSKGPAQSDATPGPLHANLGGGNGDYEIEVVGESKYQSQLRSICGPGKVRHECTAELHMDNSNAHDSKAVLVKISGKPVGYLNRDDARSYRSQLKGHESIIGRCPAVIVGGGPGKDFVGVWLDLPGDDDDEDGLELESS